MECSWFSGTAVMVSTQSVEQSAAVAATIETRLTGVRGRVGLAYVLVEPERPDPQLLERVSATVAGMESDGAPLPLTGPPREVAVHYEGEDLPLVAAALGLGVPEVIAHHGATLWRVLMLGFAPGFGYLGAVEPPIDWTPVARLSSPRRRVPGGSVGVAAGMSCIYPAGMPGGWPIIGRAEVTLFHPDDEGDPTLLHPGDLLRFVDAR